MTETLSKTELPAHVLPELLADLLLKNQLKLATAESCTGGMISAACTDLAGSSAWFERGFVTYSNIAKTEMLGVEERVLRRAGAVCEGVARAMVTGALAHSHAQVAVAVTGVAGPTGGSPAKPVGTVWFGFAVPGQVVTEKRHFEGDRAAVRAATVHHAFKRLFELLACPTDTTRTHDNELV
jgi:nicotinamide-nucleotide amidase